MDIIYSERKGKKKERKMFLGDSIYCLMIDSGRARLVEGINIYPLWIYLFCSLRIVKSE